MLSAQCEITVTGMPDYQCDDNGTADPSDDEYTAYLSVFREGADYAWVDTVGPYDNSAGDQIITLVDPLDPSCTATYTLVAPANCNSFVCPDYEICAELVSEDGCSATFYVTINVDSDIEFTMSGFNIGLFLTNGNGTIDSYGFINPNGPLADNEVLLMLNASSTGLSISEGSDISSLDLDGILPSIFINVTGTVGQSLSVGTNTGGGLFFDGMPCVIDQSCAATLPFTPDGQQVGGQITTMSNAVGPCPNTQGLGIERANLIISNDNGSCTSVTSDSGRYNCPLCEDVSYEVCVTNTCDEPCGLENADLIVMQQIILNGNITAVDEFMGDLNGDGVFSTLDRHVANKKLQGQDVSNIIRSWCRFVPLDDYTAAISGSMNTIDIDECYTTTNPNQDVDFFRFALGDFNGSCDDCTHNDGTGPFPIIVEQGSDFAQFHVDQDKDLESFVFDISLDRNTIISSVESEIEGLDYAVNDDILKIYWFPDEASKLTIQKGEELFRINGSGISNGITVDNNQSFLLDSEFVMYQISNVEYRDITSSNKKTLSIANHNIIDLDYRSEEAIVSLYNLNGVLLNQRNIYLEQNNSIDFDNSIVKNGIYIVHIKTSHEEVASKIIVMHP